MALTIAPLADHPHCRDRVIHWLWQAFGQGASRAYYAAIVDSSMRLEGLPITFIALEEGQPVGTVGLWRCDLISRQDLSPWLAALYIDEGQRGRGLGRQLQAYVIEHARRAGFDNLYLYATFTGYYEQQGWQPMGDGIEYPDLPVHLYGRYIGRT